jgi:CheY-like chemotaxis protein
LIQAYLKETGYRLDEAEDGAIAVSKLKAGNHDLVLMDMQMPVMDGLEATRAIRDWERERGLPRTPILALTASALDEDVRRALEAGADMHISKPIRKAVLKAAIKNSTRSFATLTVLKSPATPLRDQFFRRTRELKAIATRMAAGRNSKNCVAT